MSHPIRGLQRLDYDSTPLAIAATSTPSDCFWIAHLNRHRFGRLNHYRTWNRYEITTATLICPYAMSRCRSCREPWPSLRPAPGSHRTLPTQPHPSNDQATSFPASYGIQQLHWTPQKPNLSQNGLPSRSSYPAGQSISKRTSRGAHLGTVWSV